MYDSIEDMKLLPESKSKGKDGDVIPLPDYDTVSFEKELAGNTSSSFSQSEATGANGAKPADMTAEYSVVMKKTKASAPAAGSGESEDYNVLVHNTKSSAQPHQTLATYSSLKESGSNSTSAGPEVVPPPPPLPPPISESNLKLVIGGGGIEPHPSGAESDNSQLNAVSSTGMNGVNIEQKRNESYVCELGDVIQGAVPSLGEVEGESLYMNV